MADAGSWRILILMMLHSSTFSGVAFIWGVGGGSIRVWMSTFSYLLFTIFIVVWSCLFLRGSSDVTRSDLSKCLTCLGRLIIKKTVGVI